MIKGSKMKQRLKFLILITGVWLGGCDQEGVQILEIDGPDEPIGFEAQNTQNDSGDHVRAADTDPALKQFIKDSQKRFDEHVIQIAGLRFISESLANIELIGLLDALESKRDAVQLKLQQIKRADAKNAPLIQAGLNTLLDNMDSQYQMAIEVAQNAPDVTQDEAVVTPKKPEQVSDPIDPASDKKRTGNIPHWDDTDDAGLPPGFEDDVPEF